MKSATTRSDASLTVREQRDALVADQSVQGPAFGRALAALVDEWLRGLLPDSHGIAVVAIGGYGRSELAPGSDLDILLVHAGRNDVAQVADRLWYPIWDAGFRLDHSVRTVREVLAMADDDLKVALGLLDARLVVGDEQLFDGLVERTAERWRKNRSRWIPHLAESVHERQEQFGSIAFLLEPDLKEGRGALRDVTIDRALRCVVEAPEDALDVAAVGSELFGVRVALHRVSGRRDDRLSLEYQDDVARELDLSDADELMRVVATAGRVISWHLDDLLRSAVATGRGRAASVRQVPIGHGLSSVAGELYVEAVDPTDPAASLLEAAATAAEQRLALSRKSLQLLADAVPPLTDAWSERDRVALVRLLGQGQGCISVFESLDRYNLVSRFLPEWERVRTLPQRNAFHHFTVDRHLVEAAAQAAALCDRVERPDLLLVGAWLHDLGKGGDEDHTEVGVTLMRTIGTRMGFAVDDVETLVALVDQHLLLPAAATSRDLGDPDAIAAVGAAIETPERLDLLHALTEADSIATGASAWSPWKAELVSVLVARVHDWFGGVVPDESDAIDDADLLLVERAGGDLLVDGQERHLVVVAPDEPRLFSRVVGLLGLYGQDVRAARARSPIDGVAISEFDVEPRSGGALDWGLFAGDLHRARRGRLAIDARLRERADQHGLLHRPRSAFRPVARVSVDNRASATSTVIEIRAADAIGLLYRITRTLADFHLDIRHAKALTLGPEVVDTFYVVTEEQDKVQDGDDVAEIERALLDAVRERDQAVSFLSVGCPAVVTVSPHP